MAAARQKRAEPERKSVLGRLRQDEEWWEDFTRIMANHLSWHYNEANRPGA